MCPFASAPSVLRKVIGFWRSRFLDREGSPAERWFLPDGAGVDVAALAVGLRAGVDVGMKLSLKTDAPKDFVPVVLDETVSFLDLQELRDHHVDINMRVSARSAAFRVRGASIH